jgi:2,7-dihydroxy-5-methyl-1-naphthoate 7-O-methyltransferase
MPEPADLQALSDLRTPWCVRVAATLRIADHISKGIADIEALAEASGSDAYVLHCILSELVARGVFEQPEPGRFALNDAARGLLDPKVLIGLDLNGIGGRFAHAWSTLLTYVRTGRSGYHEVFGRSFWEDLEANPVVAESFDALIGPTGHGRPNPNFEITGGWQSIRSVVDVGGGTGAMLAEILRAHPQIRGTLLDLPRTVARSSPIFNAARVTDRVTTVGQSFFDPLPAGADLYLLKAVLNDWPSDETVAILRRCAEAARPAGRVVALGGVSPDEALKRLTIEMVLLGGRTNGVSEFRELARKAGLEVVVAESQPAGYFVVEMRPL